MLRDISCSVVIPVYNSESILHTLIKALGEKLPELCRQYEVILVNDGSRDDSWSVIEQLVEEHAWVVGVDLMRNFGQHNAILGGINLAQYEIIITMDDDLQHPPDQISLLLEKLKEGYDVVYGTPRQEQHGLWRDMASNITKMALRSAMGVDVARNASAFRAFRTEVREAFKDYHAPTVSIDVLLSWGTSRFAAVEVRHDPRKAGESNYTFRKLVRHAVNMMTGFTTLPLHFASFVGFGFTILGMILLVYVMARYAIEGGSVPGFPFLASTIAIFSGVQLFALGIIGEYLARLYQRSMGEPPSVIRQIIKSKKET